MAFSRFLTILFIASIFDVNFADHDKNLRDLDKNIAIAETSKFSRGFRSGRGGWKSNTGTPSMHYGTEDFHFPLILGEIEDLSFKYIVSDLNQLPGFDFIHFENRTYAWSAHQVQQRGGFKIICEYRLGADDGDVLRNLKFSDKTPATSLFFGCPTLRTCCGMFCCHNAAVYFGIAFVLIMLYILYRFCRWYRHYRRKVMFGNGRARLSFKE